MNWSVEDQKTQIQTFLYSLGLIFFLFGFFMNTLLLLLAGLFLLGLAYMSKKYLEYAIAHFYLDNSGSPLHLSTGESSQFVLTFVNTSRLPFISARGQLTTDKNVSLAAASTGIPIHTFRFALAMRAKQKAEVSCPVNALHRGIARIRTLEIVCEDPFHVFRCTLRPNEMIRTRIIVYPKPEPVHSLDRIVPVNLGFDPASRSLFKDYTLPAGIRDYARSDPFRHIHWKASARLGKLQTKTFEKVAQVSWTFLFLSTPNYHVTQTTEDFERQLSAAAFMAEYACKHHYPYDIYCNNKPMGPALMTFLEENQGVSQLKKALELFSFMQKWQIKTPVDRVIRAIRSRLTGARMIFIIDLDPSGTVQEQLHSLLTDGHSIYQLMLSEHSAAFIPIMETGGAAVD